MRAGNLVHCFLVLGTEVVTSEHLLSGKDVLGLAAF